MKKLLLTICSVLCAVSSILYGQKSTSTLKEYFEDAEFFFSKEYYIDALNDFQQLYKKGYANNPNINYKIGVCYLKIPGQKDKAINYLEKATLSASSRYKTSSLNEKYAPLDAFLYLGNAYRINNQLNKAIVEYKKYEELLPDNAKELHRYTELQILACNAAAEFMRKPVDVTFKNLGPTINSSSDDFKAVISGNDSVMVYMRKLPFYDAVYFSKKVGDTWGKPINITPQIMSDGDQYVCSLSYNGKLLFLSKEDEYNSDIYKSIYVNNRWGKSVPLGSEVNTKYWESHASISKDGKLLYFTSNRKGGQGNMDIYVAEKKDDGTFGNVKNLGPQINTDLNEDTPFITDDGNTLYFSSQGYVSMGGYDVYVSHKDGENGWTPPENLGYPINTTDDDLFYYPYDNGKEGIMSRMMDGGYGGMDIYEVINNENLIEEEISSKQALPDIGGKGTISDSSKITSAESIPESKEASDTVGKSKVAEKKESVTKPQPHVVRTLEIAPLLFDFDRTELTQKAKEELNKVADLMKNDLQIKLHLLGYADALGPVAYNQRLSESRAISAMRYLIAKGIEASRLKADGKGETDYIAPNTKPDGSDNPDGRKYNRRVEFMFKGIDKKSLIIKRINPVPKDMRIQQK